MRIDNVTPRLLSTLVLSLCLASPAAAQASKGDQEVILFGSLTTNIQKDFSGGRTTSTNGNFFLNIGQYVTDALEVGGGPLISFQAVQGGGTSSDLGLNTFLRYHLGNSSARSKPYVGAEYLVTSVKNDVANSQYVQMLVGVKNYMSERAALDMAGAYGFLPNHAADRQVFTFRMGITVLF
jgi:hypothetical protein